MPAEMAETLGDELRRVTRNFTAPLQEEAALALGRELLRELERAHSESPARHPDLSPSSVRLSEGKPVLEGGPTEGSVADDLFRLGALLCSLASGRPAHVSWRLDGPSDPPGTTILRRSLFAALASPLRERRFVTAAEAIAAIEAALAPAAAAAWPMFRNDVGRQGAAEGPPVVGLEPLWTAGVGATVASPVVAGGAVLAAT